MAVLVEEQERGVGGCWTVGSYGAAKGPARLWRLQLAVSGAASATAGARLKRGAGEEGAGRGGAAGARGSSHLLNLRSVRRICWKGGRSCGSSAQHRCIRCPSSSR